MKTKQLWEDIDFLIESSSDELIEDIMKRSPKSIPTIISSLLTELREYRAAQVVPISSLDDELFSSEF